MGRQLQARVDLAALQHNLQRVKEIAPGRSIIAMVKANGYGHGLIEVARSLQAADGLGVASIEEAIELRQAGIKSRIVLMEGFVSEQGLKNVITWQLELVVHQIFQIDLLEKYASRQVKTWVKINTGMNRLGFAEQSLLANLSRIANSSDIMGIMTHFSDADALDKPKTMQQLTKFTEITAKINKPYPCSLANSAAILAWPMAHGDWVRPGLMLYGVSPFGDSLGIDFNLKPAMTFVAKLIAIQSINKNETIGYTSRFTCPEDMSVGVIAIGYADGYPLHTQDGTPVLLNDRRTSIIGKISMDMATIDLRGHQEAKIGDEVILWGNGLPIEEVAQQIGASPWELLTSVGTRVRRVYYETKIL